MNRIIVDGFNLAFRSHYAFQRFSTSSGVLSGCVYGFLVGLRSLKNKYPGFHVMIAWDNEATRKKKAFSEYKANRDHFDIGPHIKDLKAMLSCVNITQAEMIGEEADDVIASMVKRYSHEGVRVYVYTSDKDMLQLVRNGRVIVIKPKTGGYPEKAYDEEMVFDEYGVYPSEMACYLALRGDTSDNIPGVPRAPSKLLASLSHKHKDPEIVYRCLEEEELTDFQRRSITVSEQQVYTNFSIIRLSEDLPYDESKGTARKEVFQTYLDKYELKAINADSFVDMFEGESAFGERCAPAPIQNISLF